MNRDELLVQLNQKHIWDMIIIGGGATGLGVAIDASLRGYKVLLLEQSDFGKGTSSRSTKLVHGGVRYLAQGNFRLVLEALKERGLLLKNAPHLTKNQTFIIPIYSWWDAFVYTTGLKLYDILAGTLSLGTSQFWGRTKTLANLTSIQRKDLKGGVVYHDGQFDDARLAINMAQTAIKNGACVLNYLQVNGLVSNSEGKVVGVSTCDVENDTIYNLQAKVVINATGVFVDHILNMENKKTKPIVRASQGVHLVLDRSFLPGEHALMIPKTSDGRVLFAVPWHDKVIVGTTDTLVNIISIEPKALEQEITFILETAANYLTTKPTRSDVLSVFAGLRPLAASQQETTSTKELSRSHKLLVSDSGLITITGGKWTTYRKMAEDTVNTAIRVGALSHVPCSTQHYPIHGYMINADHSNHLYVYGTDAENIQVLIKNDTELGVCLHPSYPYTKAEAVWAIRNEMARTVEDILARRLRVLFLDARAALHMAPQVAQLLAFELNKDQLWIDDQLKLFISLAQGYIVGTDNKIGELKNEQSTSVYSSY